MYVGPVCLKKKSDGTRALRKWPSGPVGEYYAEKRTVLIAVSCRGLISQAFEDPSVRWCTSVFKPGAMTTRHRFIMIANPLTIVYSNNIRGYFMSGCIHSTLLSALNSDKIRVLLCSIWTLLCDTVLQLNSFRPSTVFQSVHCSVGLLGQPFLRRGSWSMKSRTMAGVASVVF